MQVGTNFTSYFFISSFTDLSFLLFTSIFLNEILLAIYHQRLSKQIQEYLIYLKQGWTLAGIYMTSSDPASNTSIPRAIERSDAVVEASVLGSPDVKR